MGESTWEVARLPGFRFHPTEEELLGFYLQNTILGKNINFDTIGFLNIYLHDPKELPELAKNGEREWYFFVPRDRRHGNGGRPNRTTETGFWKATGSDRKIMSSNDPKKIIGLKKTLVFYKGRAPRGCKTDWVMNEYRLPDTFHSPKDIVLCKIYRKATSLKELEQRAQFEQEEEEKKAALRHSLVPPPMDMTTSFCNPHVEEEGFSAPIAAQHVAFKKEYEDASSDQFTAEEEKSYYEEEGLAEEGHYNGINTNGFLQLTELQVPKFNMDWTQDPSWGQLKSPWLENLMTPSPYANLLNF